MCIPRTQRNKYQKANFEETFQWKCCLMLSSAVVTIAAFYPSEGMDASPMCLW